MLTRSLFLALAARLPACAGQTDAPADDDASLADDAKADRTWGGLFVLPDSARSPLRRPEVGGSFVKRVNFPTTTCVDGRPPPSATSPPRTTRAARPR